MGLCLAFPRLREQTSRIVTHYSSSRSWLHLSLTVDSPIDLLICTMLSVDRVTVYSFCIWGLAGSGVTSYKNNNSAANVRSIKTNELYIKHITELSWIWTKSVYLVAHLTDLLLSNPLQALCQFPYSPDLWWKQHLWFPKSWKTTMPVKMSDRLLGIISDNNR